MVYYGRKHTQGSPVETQTLAHWNLISHSMTAPPTASSPNSILPPTSSHCALISPTKNSTRLKNTIIFFSRSLPFLNRASLKLPYRNCANCEMSLPATPQKSKGLNCSTAGAGVS